VLEQVHLSKNGVSGSVLDWLLEENEPSVRYHALTQLLDRDQSDAQVEKTRPALESTDGLRESLLNKRKTRTGTTRFLAQFQSSQPVAGSSWSSQTLESQGRTRESETALSI